MKIYFYLVTVLTGLVLLSYILLLQLQWIERASFDWQILLSIVLASLLSFIFITKMRQVDAHFTLTAILGSVVIRLLFFSVLNLIWIYLDRDGAIANALLFFIIYLLFTVAETAYLVRFSHLFQET